MLRFAIPTILAAVVSADSLAAQGTRERIEQEVLETQRRMREGKLVSANVRVTVRLKNGSRLRGVVKNGRFIERFDKREFIETDAKGPTAGLRLWYYDDTDSYIFLPYETLAHYKIGEKLTDEEVEAIAKRIEVTRRKSEEQRKAANAAKSAQEAKDREAKDKAAENGKPVIAPTQQPKTKLTEVQQKLLADYPPASGWGLDKLQELERRKITIGVFPNEQEKRFIDSFGEWNEAFEIWQSEQDARVGAPIPQPAPTPAPAPVQPGR